MMQDSARIVSLRTKFMQARADLQEALAELHVRDAERSREAVGAIRG